MAAFTGCSALRGTSYSVTGQYNTDSVICPGEGLHAIAFNDYNDNGVRISPYITPDDITVWIRNDTQSSIKVLWDDAAFIDGEGISHRIIHTGTKYIDKEKAQVPSVVAQSSEINDSLYPVDYVILNNTSSGTIGWSKQPLLDLTQKYRSKEEALNVIACINSLKLLLPIEYNGIKKEYLFSFSGDGYSVHEEQWSQVGVVIGLGVAVGVLVATSLLKDTE